MRWKALHAYLRSRHEVLRVCLFESDKFVMLFSTTDWALCSQPVSVRSPNTNTNTTTKVEVNKNFRKKFTTSLKLENTSRSKFQGTWTAQNIPKLDHGVSSFSRRQYGHGCVRTANAISVEWRCYCGKPQDLDSRVVSTAQNIPKLDHGVSGFARRQYGHGRVCTTICNSIE